MSNLVKELKQDHVALFELLDQVQKLSFTSKEGQQKLLDAKTSLLAHLKKEDDQLYPVLKKAAASDTTLKWTLDNFASEMDKISGAAIQFFDKYTSSQEDHTQFAKDFNKLAAGLKGRIRREENVLYEEFDKRFS